MLKADRKDVWVLSGTEDYASHDDITCFVIPLLGDLADAQRDALIVTADSKFMDRLTDNGVEVVVNECNEGGADADNVAAVDNCSDCKPINTKASSDSDAEQLLQIDSTVNVTVGNNENAASDSASSISRSSSDDIDMGSDTGELGPTPSSEDLTFCFVNTNTPEQQSEQITDPPPDAHVQVCDSRPELSEQCAGPELTVDGDTAEADLVVTADTHDNVERDESDLPVTDSSMS